MNGYACIVSIRILAPAHPVPILGVFGQMTFMSASGSKPSIAAPMLKVCRHHGAAVDLGSVDRQQRGPSRHLENAKEVTSPRFFDTVGPLGEAQ